MLENASGSGGGSGGPARGPILPGYCSGVNLIAPLTGRPPSSGNDGIRSVLGFPGVS